MSFFDVLMHGRPPEVERNEGSGSTCARVSKKLGIQPVIETGMDWR